MYKFQSMQPNIFDTIIIGGGPSGLNVAIEAAKANLNYLVLEKGVLVNSLYNFPANMMFFSTSKLLEIGNVPFISHTEKPTRREALEYYRRLVESYAIKVKYYEEVLDMQRQPDGLYKISTTKGEYFTYAVVVATGYYDTPNQLNVPGEELPKVKHYYDDAHPYVGQKVLVVGAKNSAAQVALELWQKGAEVTLVHRGEEISSSVKYWIRPNIVNRIEEGSIKGYFRTTVKEIRPTEVVLQTPEGEVTIENDFVLAMTGYRPNFALLRKLGIEITDEDCKPAHDIETLETNLPHVYTAGVVCAGMQTSKLFIENTRNHGAMVVNDIVKKLAVVAGTVGVG